MKIRHILFTLLACFLLSCGSGFKNYTLNKGKVKFIRSTMGGGSMRQLSATKGMVQNIAMKPIDSFKLIDPKLILPTIANSIPKFENLAGMIQTDTFISYTSIVGNGIKTRSDGTKIPVQDLEIQNSKYNRILKAKKSRFFTVGSAFDISPNYVNRDTLIFTIENLEFNFTRLKITKENPVIYLFIQFSGLYGDNLNMQVADPLIIPCIAGDTAWNSSISYQKYYTTMFPKANLKAVKLSVSEFYKKDLTLSNLKGIKRNQLTDLEVLLNTIALKTQQLY